MYSYLRTPLAVGMPTVQWPNYKSFHLNFLAKFTTKSMEIGRAHV